MNKDPAPLGASDLEGARRLLSTIKPEKASVALLSTVSAEGRPHATWMFVSRSLDPGIDFLTITSPESSKLGNVSANPKVEWLISSQDRMEQLYLEGDAEIIEDVAEIKRLWAMIGGKDKAYFMKYYNSGMGFTIVRTRVSAAFYSLPEEYRKVGIPLDDFK